MHSGYDLSEEVSGLLFRDVLLVTDVVIQVSLAGILHHYHNLVLVFKHCKTTQTAASEIQLVYSKIIRAKTCWDMITNSIDYV